MGGVGGGAWALWGWSGGVFSFRFFHRFEIREIEAVGEKLLCETKNQLLKRRTELEINAPTALMAYPGIWTSQYGSMYGGEKKF